MSRVDFVFYALSFFCYLSITLHFKNYEAKLAKMNELNKKRESYSLQMQIMKGKDEENRRNEAKKSNNNSGTQNKAALLSNLSEPPGSHQGVKKK